MNEVTEVLFLGMEYLFVVAFHLFIYFISTVRVYRYFQ